MEQNDIKVWALSHVYNGPALHISTRSPNGLISRLQASLHWVTASVCRQIRSLLKANHIPHR